MENPMRESVLFAMAVLLSAAPVQADGAAALYQTKCQTCHGTTGAGRAAMKGSNLLTPEVKKRTDAELADAIARGGAKKSASHAYEKKGVKPEQVTLLVGYVRKLQKQAE
jgi:mono/diheme cytochrome c family protein